MLEDCILGFDVNIPTYLLEGKGGCGSVSKKVKFVIDRKGAAVTTNTLLA
jgi:hypothetical protein